jgi:hypothetical protein
MLPVSLYCLCLVLNVASVSVLSMSCTQCCQCLCLVYVLYSMLPLSLYYNTETLTTLSTRHRTKTNKTHHRKLKRWATKTIPQKTMWGYEIVSVSVLSMSCTQCCQCLCIVYVLYSMLPVSLYCLCFVLNVASVSVLFMSCAQCCQCLYCLCLVLNVTETLATLSTRHRQYRDTGNIEHKT